MSKTSLRDLRGPLVAREHGSFAGQLAKQMRQTFMDRDSEYGMYDTGASWPSHFTAIGKGLSFAYTSHKWEKGDTFNDYKHVAEAPQTVYAAPVLASQGLDVTLDGSRLVAETPDFALPLETAELTPLLFVEMQLFDSVGRGGEGVLPRSKHAGLRRIVLKGAMLYGGFARKPGAPESSTSRRDYVPFLFAASKADKVILLVTGRDLKITRDGIEG